MRPYTKAFRRKRNLLTNPYTTINSGSSHTPPRVDDVFSYRARARPIDDALAKLFGLYDGIDNEPRVEALQRRADFIAERMRAWDVSCFYTNNVYDHITYRNGRRKKVFLFWNRPRTVYLFVEVLFHADGPSMFRRSLGMSSREMAHELFFSDSVRWQPYESLPITRD